MPATWHTNENVPRGAHVCCLCCHSAQTSNNSQADDDGVDTGWRCLRSGKPLRHGFLLVTTQSTFDNTSLVKSRGENMPRSLEIYKYIARAPVHLAASSAPDTVKCESRNCASLLAFVFRNVRVYLLLLWGRLSESKEHMHTTTPARRTCEHTNVRNNGVYLLFFAYTHLLATAAARPGSGSSQRANTRRTWLFQCVCVYYIFSKVHVCIYIHIIVLYIFCFIVVDSRGRLTHTPTHTETSWLILLWRHAATCECRGGKRDKSLSVIVAHKCASLVNADTERNYCARCGRNDDVSRALRSAVHAAEIHVHMHVYF